VLIGSARVRTMGTGGQLLNSRQRIGLGILAFGVLISAFAGLRYATKGDDSAQPTSPVDTNAPGEEATIENGGVGSFGDMLVSVKSVSPRADGQLEALISFATTDPKDPVKDLTVTVGDTIDVKGGAFVIIELGRDTSPRREFARMKFVKRG
jgi:hypothetical protein